MPFKSEAQRRKFAELLKEGKISLATWNEWNNATKKKIPERVKPKKKDDKKGKCGSYYGDCDCQARKNRGDEE